MQTHERIKALMALDGWNQERLSKALSVSIHTVKSWTRKNESDRNTPNKWVMVELEKIFNKAGVE